MEMSKRWLEAEEINTKSKASIYLYIHLYIRTVKNYPLPQLIVRWRRVFISNTVSFGSCAFLKKQCVLYDRMAQMSPFCLITYESLRQRKRLVWVLNSRRESRKWHNEADS